MTHTVKFKKREKKRLTLTFSELQTDVSKLFIYATHECHFDVGIGYIYPHLWNKIQEFWQTLCTLHQKVLNDSNQYKIYNYLQSPY